MGASRFLFILFSLIIIVCNIVDAKESAQVSVSSTGCEIDSEKISVLKANEPHTFDFRVINRTNGRPLTNGDIGCVFHYYDATGVRTYINATPSFSKGLEFEVQLPTDATSEGDHKFVFQCNSSSLGCFVSQSLLVTKNGQERPSGIVVVFFSIIFVVLCLYLLMFILYDISKLLTFTLDWRDMSLSIGGYFALLAVYMLSTSYLGDSNIDSFLLFFIKVGTITSVLLPVIGFAISYIKTSMIRGDHN